MGKAKVILLIAAITIIYFYLGSILLKSRFLSGDKDYDENEEEYDDRGYKKTTAYPGETMLDKNCGCRQVHIHSYELTRQLSDLFQVPKTPEVQSICSPHASMRGGGQKVISYSFYGSLQSAYFKGIKENLAGVQLFYPGYVMRLYYDRAEAVKQPREFEKLCEIFCTQPDFDLCDVRSIGEKLLVLHKLQRHRLNLDKR